MSSPEGSSAATPGAVLGRKGTCRLCFEGGGDLIAPCMCRGTSKWIHRDCLNSWRVSGSNPRALTNCGVCGFQYRLRLHREESLSSEGEVRRRQLLRRLASQSLLWFVGLQILVCAVACIIRAIDRHEALVGVYGFPQVKGHEGLGSFIDAVKYHKETYYVTSILVLLAILGLVVSIGLCVKGCGIRSHAREVLPDRCAEGACACCLECVCPRSPYGYSPVDAYMQIRLCEDCGNCCAICCYNCGHNCSANCGHCPGSNLGNCGDHKDLGGIVLAMVLVVVIAFIVIGLFAAIMALVTAIQKAGQEFAKIQQLRVMASEYIVQDLADPGDLGEADAEAPPPASGGGGAAAAPAKPQPMPPAQAPSAPPLPPPHSEEDLTAQAQVEQELHEMFGDAQLPTREQQAVRPGYGSV